mgnify:CR=1 FL=1
MPKWAALVITISGAVITVLLAVIGYFGVRTLDSISRELYDVKTEMKGMAADYGRLSQSVAVILALNDTQNKVCRFPQTKQGEN